MDGILNINKPLEMTSYRMVALVKRLSGERHAGHAGTLDPAASGVLPVCLGQATRVVEYLMQATKTYRAEIELGVTTDTYDAAGKVTETKDASHITREQVESALAAFSGTISQTPPMYSAVRHHGQRLYSLARAGITVDRPSRLAQIYSLKFTDWQSPVATIEVECGKGTYIRSLAHDLGQSLGCGASLKSLVRLRYGPFALADALSLPRLEEAARDNKWIEFLHPIDSVLAHLSAVTVDEPTTRAITCGQAVTLPGQNNSPPPGTGSRCRVYNPSGDLLAILSFNTETGQWHPDKVFLPPRAPPC
ncbi:MAG: tRNA pseudouridine(55) synthase TruB [Chloroflexota bacterium]|nr:tRNA pseudouridine(55) synthase TruB [Chloroflexota bacterium]